MDHGLLFVPKSAQKPLHSRRHKNNGTLFVYLTLSHIIVSSIVLSVVSRLVHVSFFFSLQSFLIFGIYLV